MPQILGSEHQHVMGSRGNRSPQSVASRQHGDSDLASGRRGPIPSISLPKSGGAVRGMGEKFSVNPATRTGSIIVPLPFSPSLSDSGPQLSLFYDSGTGNGPFEFSWRFSLRTITRKTDKGLPHYGDGEESDTFVLSVTEDLVFILGSAGSGDGLGQAHPESNLVSSEK